jgi:uncharacterized SAM-binding protein YcdF (DUF218 family)
MVGLARWTGPALLLAAVLFLTGFVLFANRIARLETPIDVAKADAIVVLTGGQYRLETGLTLLAEHKAEHMLISGVHPDTTETGIARATGSNSALFECCIEIGYRAKDTVGNATETVAWLKKNKFRSVILVTNNYHLPRSVLELRRIDPTLDIRPHPVVNTDLTDGKWMLKADTLRVLMAEYMKYLGAKTRAVLPIPASLSSIL